MSNGAAMPSVREAFRLPDGILSPSARHGKEIDQKGAKVFAHGLFC
jgi:hypothetical protein